MKTLFAVAALFTFFLFSCGSSTEKSNKIICDSLSAYQQRERGVHIDTMIILDKQLIAEKDKLQMNVDENRNMLNRYSEKIKMDSERLGENINHLDKYEKMWNGTAYPDVKVSKEDSQMYSNYAIYRWDNEFYKGKKNAYDSFLHLCTLADSVTKNHYICIAHMAAKGHNGEVIFDERFFLDNHYQPFFLWETVKKYANPDSGYIWERSTHLPSRDLRQRPH